jgi:hypothetical protein
MIKITYTDNIKIETGDLTGILRNEQLPINFQIKNAVSKKIIWQTNLNSFMWASFPSTEMNDVVVNDAQGNFIYQYRWDVIQHGSIFYKSLWLYCKSLINQGIKPKGLVIGTHDGEFGEWVPLVKNFMSDMVLVEGSEKQFNVLKNNYQGKQGVNLVNNLVTTDGADVEFFEGGAGYTNTVVKRVIEYWEKEEIHSTKRSSISINNLIFDHFSAYNKKLDWLHLDVEGLDAKLLLAIDSDKLPDFIIYEDFNLGDDEKNNLVSYLESNGYKIHSEGGIGMAKK